MNRQRRKRFLGAYALGWLGIVLVAVMGADATAQEPGRSKVIELNPATPQSETFVGILGEIGRPGVYRFDPKLLTLQSILRRSGGLTDEASGTIRVIRQDRVVERLFFTPQLDSRLLPGDLLVVESKRTQAAISKLYESDPRIRAQIAKTSEGNTARQPSGVQIAFVNVLDRPVIVKVNHENARLSHVVQMLDQPIELAQAVRVIGPERLLSQGAELQPAPSSISDGSVLIFPKNSINRGKLPSLPIPYDSEIASGAGPSLIGGSSGQSPELRNVGQLPPLVTRGGRESLPITTPPSHLDQVTTPTQPTFNPIPPSTTERLEIPVPEPMPVVSTPPRIATIPFTGERRITSSSNQISKIPEKEPNQPEPDDSQMKRSSAELPKRSGSKTESLKIDEEDTLDEDAPPATHTSKQSPLSIVQFLGIAAGIGLLVGLALITRRFLNWRVVSDPSSYSEIESALHHQAMQASSPVEAASQFFKEVLVAQPIIDSPQTAEPAPMPTGSAKSWFDQLLKNELPLREEQPEFPSEITLQGRIVPPPVFRVDQAEPTMDGPHFALEKASTSEVAPPVASQQVIDEFDTAHESRPSKPHFMRRRPGENTVAAAAMVSATQKPISAEVPHSTTPVTDALRHLQGGQP